MRLRNIILQLHHLAKCSQNLPFTQYFGPEGKRVKKSGPPTRHSKAITAASATAIAANNKTGLKLSPWGRVGPGRAGEGHEKERLFRIADEANTLEESLKIYGLGAN